LCTGDLLSDRYRLDEPIADGGMGEVWRATDISLARTVAVKVVRPALLADPGFDARFRAEARMMAALTHPNVVNVYDYGHSTLDTGGSVTFLVMAYVDGEPLSHRIAEAGRLPVAETMSIVAQAADALHAAHRHGIIHRDVKPANLLVQPNGTVKLVDFGVARSPAVTQVTAANAILGTAMYMAPEQASGQPVSPATDIYALGAVAYHCLTGQPPFTGDTPLEIALRHVTEEPPPLPADVPPRIQLLVSRALAKEPAARYPTAAALAAAARAVTVGPIAVRYAAARPTAGPTAGPLSTGAVRAAGAATPAVRAASADAPAVRAAEADSPTRPDLPVLLSPPPRGPRRGPRMVAVLGVAGVAAAVLLGLAGFGGLMGPGRPTDSSPADRSERTAAPIVPAANPSNAASAPSDQSGSRPAVPVRASAPAAVPPTPAPTPAAGGSAASTPTPTAGSTSTGEPPPSPQPTATTPASTPPSTPPADSSGNH
jgi:serine/threonine-protein kinase